MPKTAHRSQGEATSVQSRTIPSLGQLAQCPRGSQDCDHILTAVVVCGLHEMGKQVLFEPFCSTVQNNSLARGKQTRALKYLNASMDWLFHYVNSCLSLCFVFPFLQPLGCQSTVMSQKQRNTLCAIQHSLKDTRQSVKRFRKKATEKRVEWSF